MKKAALHRNATRVLAAVMVLSGAAIVVRTFAAGGGPASVGVIVGVLLAALGGLRLALALRGWA